MRRSHTAALFAGVGASTGIALGVFKFVAPALLTAAEDAARAAVTRLLAVAPAPAPLEHEWTSMLRRLPPQAQEAVIVRRTVELAVSTGRPPCRHVKPCDAAGDPARGLTWCMAKHLHAPTSCLSETVVCMSAALQGKAPPPPTPRRGTVPANYSGARPPRPPRRRIAAVKAA